MKRLLILGCSASKSDEPGEIPAVDRYRPGAYYQMLHQVPRDQWPEILILSAEFGWITGDSIIKKYDCKMDLVRANALANEQAEHDFVYKRFGCQQYDEIFVAMGKQYRQVLDEFLEDLPQGVYSFADGGIGEQRHQLKEWLQKGAQQ